MFAIELLLIIAAILTTIHSVDERKKAILEKDNAIAEIKGRIEREIIEKKAELENTAKWMEAQMIQIENQRERNNNMMDEIRSFAAHTRQAEQRVIEINQENIKLVQQVKQLIKTNKNREFVAKEAYVFLYDHYDIVSQILHDFVEGEPIDHENMIAVLNTASHNRDQIFGQFNQAFGTNPIEYKNRKVKLTGKKQNGEEWTGEFSKN